MKTAKLILAVLLSVLIAAPLHVEAKKKKVDIYELSLDDNLELPEITNDKQCDRIQDYQYQVAVALKKSNYDVELMRDEEVVVELLSTTGSVSPRA